MSEGPLEKLLQRLQHARKHYQTQDIAKFRKDISLLGMVVYSSFHNVKGVFSVGYPHYTFDNYVPEELMRWFHGRLGHALDKIDDDLAEKIKTAYEAAREDIDIFIVVGTEEGQFNDRCFAEIGQPELLYGDGKILDIKALDNVIQKNIGLRLYRFEDPDKDALVVDQTIIPDGVWFNLRKHPEEWLRTDKWKSLGIDIMFSMVNLASDAGYDFTDEFRYHAIQGYPGRTPSEKIDSIRFLPDTPHSELLRDPIVYGNWKMRMLVSYTNHMANMQASKP